MDNFPNAHKDYEGRQIASEAIQKADAIHNRVNTLEEKVKTLSLINEALFGLLVGKLSVSDSDLAAMITQVEANRKKRLESKSTCTACGRLVPVKGSVLGVKENCMYCGGSLLYELAATPFDQL